MWRIADRFFSLSIARAAAAVQEGARKRSKMRGFWGAMTLQRYRRRLRLAAEQVADEPVQDALKRVLLVSGLWIEAAEVGRDETAQQLLELIDRGIGLLAS